ncbi:YafY family transcriptional regulator [Georgenia sp. EYE_87]|uniref:helix-turn-helix transcriptional regulator n=1 Tax=Georgenia sp. EYE_87 TaxID=2853448 RepID=UPI002004BBF2|nr:YafY family protein [Georgenia sp. EYE_87]MCK6211220.1 YafY family transcriptional regulator [Georgenia sp. EYE_87]
MSDPTARALRLLSLLQTHRFWSGPELAGRLGVSERTLRRDVDRLRELGYRVAAQPGAAGGYQLEGGASVPPLLLDDDEAVAIAVGLRTAAVQGVGEGEQTSLRALAKIEQVLPRNLRRRVSALQEHTIPAVRSDARVAADVLAQLALACRDHERVRFRYTARSGTETSRLVEPHSLVPRDRRWYLVAWDVARADWRTFRIDRLTDLFSTGARVAPRELPAEDAAEFVLAAHAGAARRYEATVRMRATMGQVRAHFGVWAADAVEGPGGTVDWPIGGPSVPELLMALLWIPADYEWTLLCDDDVAAAVRTFRDRLARAL